MAPQLLAKQKGLLIISKINRQLFPPFPVNVRLTQVSSYEATAKTLSPRSIQETLVRLIKPVASRVY